MMSWTRIYYIVILIIIIIIIIIIMITTIINVMIHVIFIDLYHLFIEWTFTTKTDI